MSLDLLTGVDWFAIIVMAWLLVLGFVRGFVRELMRLCAWIGGLWLGQRYAGKLAPVLRQNIKGLDSPFDSFVAYALILGAVLVACWFVTRMFHSGLQRLQLQSYDRLLGAVLGAAKGVIVVTFAVLCVNHAPGVEQAKALVKKSQSARLAGIVVKHVQPLFPKSIEGELDALFNPVIVPPHK